MTGALSFTPAYFSRVWVKARIKFPSSYNSTRSHLLRYERPQLVKVHTRLVEVAVVGVHVEVPHTNLERREVEPSQKIDGNKTPFQSSQDGTCRSWSCDDADHQRYHDLQDASCAFRSFHGRERRGLSTSWSSSCMWPSLPKVTSETSQDSVIRTAHPRSHLTITLR